MQQVGGSLGVAFLNTIATTATTSYAKAHGGLTNAAVVHGFTSAFAVSVGIFAVAAIVVVSLIRTNNTDTPSREQSSDADDAVVGELEFVAA